MWLSAAFGVGRESDLRASEGEGRDGWMDGWGSGARSVIFLYGGCDR